VAELVANCFKHAFCEERRGSVLVSFKEIGEGWKLQVADNGGGLPAGFDPMESTGVGMRVIAALVERFGARLDVSSTSKGATFSVSLEKQPKN